MRKSAFPEESTSVSILTERDINVETERIETSCVDCQESSREILLIIIPFCIILMVVCYFRNN